MVADWRRFLLGAAATFSHYSAAACEAIILISLSNEILLKAALVFTKSLALYLSIMLKLNAFLRLTMAGVLSSLEDSDRGACSSCSTWPSSQRPGNNSCSSLCCGGRRAVRWWKSVQAAMCVLPAICQHSLSVCVTILFLGHSVLTARC